MPKLSVIIPVYNAEKYLKQCLDSVINQTMQDLEMICVDDGSTDSSLQILNSYAEKDNRITILTQENLHAGVARNNGLAIAKGEYVHFLDADDWLELKAYEKFYEIAKDKEADVCVCLYNKFNNETGEITKRGIILKKQYISESNFKENPHYFIKQCPIEPWNKIYRREFLQKHEIHFDDLICANDESFYYRVLVHAKIILVIQEYWINHRINNISSLNGNEILSRYFDCHFRNFESVGELISSCDDSVKLMYLQEKIGSLFRYYRQIIGSEMENTVREQFGDYLGKMDMSSFGHNIYQYEWYKEYLELTGFGEPPEVTIRRTLAEQKVETEKLQEKLDLQKKQIKSIKENEKKLQAYINTIHASRSWRLVHFLTFPVRKLRRGIQCLRENGLTYTCKLFKSKTFKTNSPSLIVIDPKPIMTCGLSNETRHPKIIVSLTSFPARIGIIHKTIQTLLKQTVKPDMLILWLANEQFPGKERELPDELLDLKNYGLSICWCEDLKSYKKLIPTLRKFPNDIIVTADDDVYYSEKWLELLYNSYKKETSTFVHCHQVTRFFNIDGDWHTIPVGRSVHSQPSYLHKICGGAGALYPPNSLHTDVLKIDLMKSIIPTNDDIWYWLMAVLNNTKIKVVKECISTQRKVESVQQGSTLTKNKNHGDDLFWLDFNRMLEHYPDIELILKRDYELMLKVDRFTAIPEKDRTYEFYKSLSFEEYLPALMVWYHRRTKMYLNLDNPRTFNEKIQWLKLYDSTPLKTRLADKYLVRDWVAKKIGHEYLVPLFGVWNSFDEINFNMLPNRFVLKTNHGYNNNIIVMDKLKLNIKDAKIKFDTWMSEIFDIQGLELHYWNIPVKIIAEQFIDGIDDLKDYKFLCFGGEVKYIWVDSLRYTDHRRDIFDTKWNHQPFLMNFPNADNIPEPPIGLEKMIELARVLCRGFAHVRVDFYNVNGVIYFGEMTFTSTSGKQKIEPIEFAYKMGDWINLPKPTVFLIK